MTTAGPIVSCAKCKKLYEPRSVILKKGKKDRTFVPPEDANAIYFISTCEHGLSHPMIEEPAYRAEVPKCSVCDFDAECDHHKYASAKGYHPFSPIAHNRAPA